MSLVGLVVQLHKHLCLCSAAEGARLFLSETEWGQPLRTVTEKSVLLECSEMLCFELYGVFTSKNEPEPTENLVRLSIKCDSQKQP